MSGGRIPIYLMLGVGIVIGVTLGLVVSGTLDPFLAPGVSAPTGESRTPTEPQSGPDPNVVLVAADREAMHSQAARRALDTANSRTALPDPGRFGSER